MELQGKVYNVIKDILEVIVSKYYQPYSWLPHMTIGRKLDKNQMAAAFKVMQDDFVPFDEKYVKLGWQK